MRRFAAVAIFLGAMPVFAWGPEGHSLVSRIAETELTPTARARITEILGPDRTLVSIASWADEVRRSRPDSAGWHYVDIPLRQSHLSMERDCANGNCIVAKIADLRRTIQTPMTSPEQRREAVMFLVHFIGDLHEPLHCTDNDDRGGNSVRVVFFERPTSLHSLWDSGLLNRLPPADELFPELSKEAARHEKKWRKGTVVKWAEESHKATQKMVYAALPKEPPGTPAPLGADYEKKADALVKVQLEKAGVRLAAVLNETLK